MNLNKNIIESFQNALKEEKNDTFWVATQKERNQKREVVQKEILNLLTSYLEGKITTSELRERFDKKTRKEWDLFGLKGTSGAMFLNMLVLHIPDQETLTTRLKAALKLPPDDQSARKQMADFVSFLESTMAEHDIPARKLQPKRTTFFLSAWWHMQDRERWPVYYESARWALDKEGAVTFTEEPVTDYLQFHAAWRELAQALKLSVWELENLFSWLHKADKTIVPAQVSPPTAEIDAPSAPVASKSSESTQHSEIQWMLGKIGQKLGCKVWIASNDHSKVWDNEKLKNLSISGLPNLGMGEEAQKIINLIDVIWIAGSNQLAAAFEIESTTSIYSGLLRMSDLMTTCPNSNFPCFIVLPESRVSEVVKQLSRPTFQALEINQRCGFFTFESLKLEMPAIMKWAKNPSSIRDLAKFVDDAS